MSRPESSLNDSALEDLNDPSFITPPNKSGEDRPIVNIKAVSDGSEEPDELNDRQLFNAVNESEVLIKTVIDEQESVHKLEDVTKTVMAQESISATDVLAIDKALDGKLTEAIPLNRFTDTPTKTGLKKAQGFISSFIDLKKKEAGSAGERLAASLPEWSAQVQVKLNEYFMIARSSAEAIRAQAAEFVNEDPSDRRYLVYLNQNADSLTDLRRAYLSTYSDSRTLDYGKLGKEFQNLSMATNDLLMKSPERGVKVLGLSVISPIPKTAQALEGSSVGTIATTNLTILSSTLASPALITYLEQHLSVIQPVTAEDSPVKMAEKMRNQNTMATSLVEMIQFLSLVAAYFTAMSAYRDSVSV